PRRRFMPRCRWCCRWARCTPPCRSCARSYPKGWKPPSPAVSLWGGPRRSRAPMTRLCRAVIAGLFALLAAGAVLAFQPAVVFDFGGKFDKSFNEGVLNGVERFKAETGIPYRAFEISNDVQREQFLRRLAERKADIILAVGFNFAPAVEKVAKD